jgi:hypothetical protein
MRGWKKGRVMSVPSVRCDKAALSSGCGARGIAPGDRGRRGAFAELGMGGLEAAYSRPASFGIVGGCGSVFAFELGEIGASCTDLLGQSAALGMGDGAGWALRLDAIVDERIEQELFSHVLEEVHLPPAFEHAVGDLDVAQVPATGDDLRLMAVVAQPCDLPQARPALEEAHGLIVQEIIHPAPINLGATSNEPPLIDAPTAPRKRRADLD